MTGHKISSSHPPKPPTAEEYRFQSLRLLRSRRVGIATYDRLIAEHGNPAAALAALPEIAAAAGETNYEVCPEGVIAAEMRRGAQAGAALVARDDAAYPTAMHDLHDAPPFLWARGDLDILKRPMIALVGARNASSLGTRMTRKLAADLGEAGYVVVSGLARGVDTAAHHHAIDTGTVAVMAGGVDVIYPLENSALADTIAARGLMISEQPMGLQPQARHFPTRNRLISGLAQAVVVVEAAAKSGSLITARNALDQGRDVLAVPGHPFDARAGGCNMLIRDGAVLVRSAEDVIEAIASPPARASQNAKIVGTSQPPSPPARSLRDTAVLHRQILDRLGPSPMAEDQLIRDLKAQAADVTPVLIELELDGQIERQAGGLLSLAPQVEQGTKRRQTNA
ncbi:DNA-processing protein DprA [Shimia ponticola]|uniref:DNA-processing protein DprA n=1 Tax=Shimia ponticola TaxID=2582893 RepID=UPI0011BF1A1D|nr:DNA-processing protein DprA [Shimia ponticola]